MVWSPLILETMVGNSFGESAEGLGKRHRPALWHGTALVAKDRCVFTVIFQVRIQLLIVSEIWNLSLPAFYFLFQSPCSDTGSVSSVQWPHWVLICPLALRLHQCGSDDWSVTGCQNSMPFLHTARLRLSHGCHASTGSNPSRGRSHGEAESWEGRWVKMWKKNTKFILHTL